MAKNDYSMMVSCSVTDPNRLAVTLWVDNEAYSIESDCPGKKWTGALVTREMTKAAESLKTALKAITALGEAQKLQSTLRASGIRHHGSGIRFSACHEYGEDDRDDD